MKSQQLPLVSQGNPAGCSALALGTVQLGMRYGIANVAGRPDPGTAAEIVATAWEHGVRFFDTAQAYGTSEEVLGQALAGLDRGDEAHVVTKLDANSDVGDVRAVLRSLDASVRRLKITQLWGLLLHKEEELDRWPGSIRDVFRQAKRVGLVARAGVSVYSPERALQALDFEDIAIVQVPASVFDRRMARAGVFARAAALGKTVFVRSVYLQGLALLPPGAPPRSIPRGAQAVEVLRRFCAEKGFTVQQFAVDHVRTVAPHAKVIIGAETVEQTRENCALFANPPVKTGVYEAWAETWPRDFPDLIDPRRWPSQC
jgi:aryl-alcohol dehydrogenase-like predicted oxidoreductase